jgi:superfamily II DNA or RNA helicase
MNAAASPGAAVPIPAAPPFALRAWQTEALDAIRGALAKRKRPVIHAFMGAGKSVLLAETARAACVKGLRVVILTPRQNLVKQLAGTIGAFVPGTGQWYGARKKIGRATVACYASLDTLIEAFAAKGLACDLLLVDEAHGSEGEGVKEGIERIGARFRVAVTATPYRSQRGESLTLWDEVVYRYDWRRGVAEGVIVPWRVIEWPAADCPDVDDALIALFRTHGLPGPTLTNATSIEDAETFAARLTEEGWPAAAIHSRIGAAEQERRIEDLRAGRLSVLVHVSMLSEGADFPWLRGLALRRNVGAKVRFVQEVGRVLRADPKSGKREGVVFDPLALMSKWGLDHADALGEVVEATDDDTDRPAREPGAGDGPKGKRAVKTMPVGAWLEAALETALPDLQSSHTRRPYLTAARAAVAAGDTTPATGPQWGRLERLTDGRRGSLSSFPCKETRERIRAAVARRALSRHEASLLIDVLQWAQDASASTREAAREHFRTRGTWAGAPRWEWPEPHPPHPPAIDPLTAAELRARSQQESA